MRRQLLLLTFLLLAGCAGHELDDPEKKQDKASEAEAAKATAAIDDAKCQSFGFRPGSSRYAQCRNDFDNEHKQLNGQQ